jgi:site-specific recombinase XerD
MNMPLTTSTLDHDLGDFIDWCGSRKFSKHTCSCYRSVNKQFIAWLAEYPDITRAEQITTKHIHGYQRHLAKAVTRKGLLLKPTTINRRVAGARSFLGWLYDRGRLCRPLAEQLHNVREPDLLPTSVLKHDQVKTLIETVDTTAPAGLRDRALIELLYSTGIRVGELETAKIRDLDVDAGVLRVMGKGSKERMVPVGKTARRYLTSYLRAGRGFFADRNPGVQELFLTSQGRPLRGHRIRAYLHRYAKAAGLEDDQQVTPHTLRRSCATEMIRADANLYHVKEILGHASLNTLKHYIKLNISDLKATHAKCHPRERDVE